MEFDRRHRPPGWTDQDELEEPVWVALHETGDLAVVAEYLRAGHPLGSLGEDIALLLENGTIGFLPYKVTKVGRRALAKTARLEVGAYVYIRIRRAPRGWQARIFDQAAAHFPSRLVTDRAARTAYYEFRKAWKDLGLSLVTAPIWAAALREYCAEVGADYEFERDRWHFDKIE